MYCMECGAMLSDNTYVCPKCGAQVMTPGKKTAKIPGVSESSEKSQLMIWVPDRGLFFINNNNCLCLLENGSGTVQVLNEVSKSVNFCGLGYYDGKVFFWQECRDEKQDTYGMQLCEMDPDNGNTDIVWESEEELFSDYRLDESHVKARAILYQGTYYLLNHSEQKLLCVTLPDGDWEELPLPDMRNKLPLFDWIEPRGVVDIKSDKPNFGQKYTGLAIINGEIYLSLENCMTCTLRYRRRHPEKVTYFPKNAAVTIQNVISGGMLAGVNGRVFSCPGTVLGTSEISLFEIKNDGNLTRMISNTSGDVSLQNKGGRWWRLGNTFYIGQIAIDLYERKWHKLSPMLFDQIRHRENVFGDVLDFMPGKNGVYLLTEHTLYLVPKDWETRVKNVKDLDQFVAADLDKLV